MLCTFTTKEGTLIIRSDDIRAIADTATGARVVWAVAGEHFDAAPIQGTAAENAARIMQDELDQIARIEDHRQRLQQRMAQGYPAVPVQRGRP